jgi:glycosyltransferase involved in cell wall biosynthesis
MKDVQVSIVMAVYNGQAYLEEALDSIVNQTHANFEAVIVDDGSADRTPAIMALYAARDRRIRYVRQNNKGMGAALNLGLAFSRNEIVARMDADDRMLPTRLERQLSFLVEHPQVAVLSSLVYYINEESKRFGYTKDVITPEQVRRAVSESKLVGFSHPAVMMRKDAILRAGGYRAEFWPAEDLDLWARLAEQGWDLATFPEYLLEYRIHRASVSVAQPQLALRKAGWARTCMLARRAGQAEPSWADYTNSLRKCPLMSRFNFARREAAAIKFKQGVVWLSLNKIGRAVASVVISAALQPTYFMSKAALKGPTWRGWKLRT